MTTHDITGEMIYAADFPELAKKLPYKFTYHQIRGRCEHLAQTLNVWRANKHTPPGDNHSGRMETANPSSGGVPLAPLSSSGTAECRETTEPTLHGAYDELARGFDEADRRNAAKRAPPASPSGEIQWSAATPPEVMPHLYGHIGNQPKIGVAWCLWDDAQKALRARDKRIAELEAALLAEEGAVIDLRYSRDAALSRIAELEREIEYQKGLRAFDAGTIDKIKSERDEARRERDASWAKRDALTLERDEYKRLLGDALMVCRGFAAEMSAPSPAPSGAGSAQIDNCSTCGEIKSGGKYCSNSFHLDTPRGSPAAWSDECNIAANKILDVAHHIHVGHLVAPLCDELAKHAHLFVAPPSVTRDSLEMLIRSTATRVKLDDPGRDPVVDIADAILAALAAGGIGVEEK